MAVVPGIPRLRPFPTPPRKFAPRCKKSDGSQIALRVAVGCNALTERCGYIRDLFRREGGDNFFEARITAERVPVGMEFE
jgi:hypothetical protein